MKLGQPQISVIITCPNGCRAAASALRRLKDQLSPNDEILIVEFGNCSDAEAGAVHISSTTQDDNQMTVDGLAHVHHDVVLVLEDHALIGPKFVEALRNVFSDPAIQVATFFVENGTPMGVGSQALFSFMYGFSSPHVSSPDRELAAASFAIKRQRLAEWLSSNPERARSGAIRTHLVPTLMALYGREVPEELCLLHCQTVSLLQAVQAVFLNALRHGFLEKDTVAHSAASAHAKARYLDRPARLRAVIQPTRRVMVAIWLLALSSWTGWRLGRRRHHVNILRRMAQLHPHN